LFNQQATTPIEQKVLTVIEPAIKGLGFKLVAVRISGGKRTSKVTIMIETLQNTSPILDDCSKVSRHLAVLLDVEDVIDGAYHLEVGSAGIDRVLVVAADFERYKGFDAKVTAILPINGRNNFTGTIEGMDDDGVNIKIESGTQKIQFSNIASARLVVNDKLLQHGRQELEKQNSMKGS